jgi:hypothetical protein
MKRVGIAAGVLLVAVAVGGCEDDGIPRASTCYPGILVVTPATAPAGSVITVSGPGFGDCEADRYRRYELRMYEQPQYGIDEQGRALEPVEVRRPAGAFTTRVTIPRDAEPGDRYVGYSRHPDDRDERGCDDGGGCGLPAANLTVTAAP